MPALRAQDNPFKSGNIDSIKYHFSEGGWDKLLAKLRQMNWRGAVIGPHGCGKTTLLQELSRKLSEQGFQPFSIRLNSTKCSLTPAEWVTIKDPLALPKFILLDGAECLPWFLWRRVKWLSRNFAGFVVSAHEAGFLPTLHQCSPSLPLCQKLVRELVGEVDCLSDAEVGLIYRNASGNMRLVFRELYERHSARVSVQG